MSQNRNDRSQIGPSRDPLASPLCQVASHFPADFARFQSHAVCGQPPRYQEQISKNHLRTFWKISEKRAKTLQSRPTRSLPASTAEYARALSTTFPHLSYPLASSRFPTHSLPTTRIKCLSAHFTLRSAQTSASTSHFTIDFPTHFELNYPTTTCSTCHFTFPQPIVVRLRWSL